MWLPTVLLSMRTCREEIAATYTFNVGGARPPSRRDWRKSRIVGTGQCTGSTPFAAHHSENSPHLFSYWRRVDGALAFAIVRLTDSVQVLNHGSGPPAATHRAGGAPDWGAKSAPPVGTEDLSCREGAKATSD